MNALKNKFLIKYLAASLAVSSVAAPLCAQNADRQALDRARTRQRADLQAVEDRTEISAAEVVKYAFITVSAGLAGYGVLAAAQKAALGSWFRPDSKTLLRQSIQAQLGLYEAQRQASQGLKPGEFYPASKLGKAHIERLNRALENWKTAHVYELPRAFSVNPLVSYRVKKEMEEQFTQKVAAMYFERVSALRITEATLLPAGEEGLKTYLKALERNFEKEIIREMKSGGSLNAYVTLFRAKEGRAAIRRAVAETGGKVVPKDVGKVGLFYSGGKTLTPTVGKGLFYAGRKVLPLAAIGLMWSLQGNAAEEAMLARTQADPSLLLNLNDEQFERVASSQALSVRYLEVTELLHEVARLPDKEMAFLAAQASEPLKRRPAQAVLEAELSSLAY